MVHQLSGRLLRWLARTALLMLLSASLATHAQTYCSPVYTNGCPFSNLITNVSIGTLNHSPTNCTTHDFTSLSASVAAGVPIAINVTSSGYCSVGVAIDFNNDGDFDDAGEILALPAYIASFVVVYNMTITIPAATPNGSYRMRVYNRLANSGNGTPADSPCGTYGYGSWDDYTIIVYHECATISNVTATPALLCNAGTSTLNVTYTSSIPGTVKWYTPQGALAGTGNPFTTPVLSNSATYYVAIDNGTCDTPRVPVTVTVVPPIVTPLAVSPADTTVCEGKTVKITATRAVQVDSVTAANGALTVSKTPVNGSSVNSAAELIYTSQELNISGRITNIGFYKKNANTTFNPGNVSIYMKNTAGSTVGATASLTGYSLVYSGPWPNVGIAANSWNNITLTTPFTYNGGNDNLAILVVRTAGSSSLGNAPGYRATSTGSPARSAYYIAGAWSSGVSPMTADTLRPDIRIRYEADPATSWSPVTALFKDAGLTQPMLATDTALVVYAHPAVTTTYNVYSNWKGCLSAGYLSSVVHIIDTVHVSIADSICAGQSYTFGPQILTASGTYSQAFQAVNFCDSVVTLQLTVKPYIYNSVTVNICQGQSYTFNNVTYTTTQTGLKDTFSTTGCDSIVTLNLIVNNNITPSFSFPTTLCEGTAAPVLPLVSNNSISGTWSPATVSNTATGSYTFTPAAGQCATPATITVTVSPPLTPTFTPIAPICNGSTTPVLPLTSLNGINGTWNPAVVSNTATGIYTFTPAASFCATTATLTITVKNSVTSNDIRAICVNEQPYTWNGIANAVNGSVYTTTAANGCDSVVTLNLTINPYIMHTENVSICQGHSYTFNGITYNSSQTGLKDTFSTTGCDSIVTLNLTVLPGGVLIEKDTEACGGLWYEGEYYARNTTLKDTLRNAIGCDSIFYVTHIRIYPNTPRTLVIDTVGCDRVVFEGNTYYSSTRLEDTLRSIQGCDSIKRIINITVDDFELSLRVDPDNPYKGELMHLVTVANMDPYTVLSWTPVAWFSDQHRKEYYLPANEEGKIVVTGISENGCTDTAEFTVKIRPIDYGVFVPNAFSPNGDGINDVFGPRFYMDRAYVIRNLSIFNRWGQLVYNVSHASKGAWDGRRNNGDPADAGTYGYFIDIEFLDGKELKLKGDITLIR